MTSTSKNTSDISLSPLSIQPQFQQKSSMAMFFSPSPKSSSDDKIICTSYGNVNDVDTVKNQSTIQTYRFEYNREYVPLFIAKPRTYDINNHSRNLMSEFRTIVRTRPAVHEKCLMSNGLTVGEFAMYYLTSCKKSASTSSSITGKASMTTSTTVASTKKLLNRKRVTKKKGTRGK